MKSFKQFNEETTKEITFAFGRFQPPHNGHLKLLDKVASIAKGDYEIYPSQTQDPKKNPLDLKSKANYMREMFPRHAKHIMANPKVKTVLDALNIFYEGGYTKVKFVVGSDRVKAFEFIKKYNGQKTNTGYYHFPDGIEIISAGERDPDSDDIVSAMSASRLRKAATDGNFKEFELGMPKNFKDAQDLFNDIRKGMGMKPITNFREHIQLPCISDVREQYIQNKIFNIGDSACNIKKNEIIIIQERRSNYIIDNNGTKHFILDLIPNG